MCDLDCTFRIRFRRLYMRARSVHTRARRADPRLYYIPTLHPVCMHSFCTLTRHRPFALLSLACLSSLSPVLGSTSTHPLRRRPRAWSLCTLFGFYRCATTLTARKNGCSSARSCSRPTTSSWATKILSSTSKLSPFIHSRKYLAILLRIPCTGAA